MLTNELKDKLTETLAICEIHHQRMMFAFESVNNIFHCLNRTSEKYPSWKWLCSIS